MAKKKKKFDLSSAINDIWGEYDNKTGKDSIDDIWDEYDKLPRGSVSNQNDIPGSANPETKKLFESLLETDKEESKKNPIISFVESLLHPKVETPEIPGDASPETKRLFASLLTDDQKTNEPVKPDFFKGVGILGQMLRQIGENAVSSATIKFDKNKKPNLSEGIGILGQMAGNIGKNAVSGANETVRKVQSLAAGTEPGVHGLFLSANKLLETPRNLAYPYVGKTGQDILDAIYGPSGRLGSDIAQENANQAREEFLRQPGIDNIDKSLYSIGEAVVPIGAAAISPMSMQTFFALAAGQYAKEAENEGANPLQQAAYGAVMGAVEWLTEKIPFEKMMDALGGKGGLKALLSGMNAEGLQEVVTNPVQVLAKRLMYGGGQDESLFDIGRELQSYTLGAGTFGVIRGAGAVGVGTAKVGTGLGKGIDKVVQGLRSTGVSEEQIQGMVEEAIVNQPKRYRPTSPLLAPTNRANVVAEPVAPETVEQINKVAQNLESMGVPPETVQQMVNESVANGLTTAGENLKETQALPEPVQAEATPEPVSNLANLLVESGLIMNSPSVDENVTQEQPLVNREGQLAVREPGGLIGQNKAIPETLVEETKISETTESPVKKVTIGRLIPSADLTTEQLIQRVKSYGQDKQSSYSLFVKERNLKPEIDAKKFGQIWDSVGPNRYINTETVGFTPTHFDPATQQQVSLTKNPDGTYRVLFQNGMTGNDPGEFALKRYVPLTGEKKEAVGEAVKPSLVETIVDKYLSLGWEKPIAEKNAELLADAIENNTYNDLLHPRNSKSRVIYEELTGKKLPKTIRDTKAVVEGTTYEKPEKYRIVYNKDENRTVNGYPVKAEGSQNTFFVHKVPSENKKGPIKWQVSEASTGVRATAAYPTRQAAEAAFQSIFKQHGAAKVDELVTKFPKLPDEKTPPVSMGSVQKNQTVPSDGGVSKRKIIPVRSDANPKDSPGTDAQDVNATSSSAVKNSIPQNTKTSKSDTGGYSDIEPETGVDAKEIVDKFVDETFANDISVPGLAKTTGKSIILKKTNRREIDDIKRLIGIDVTGYNHKMNSSDLRHMIKDHGDPKVEIPRGQVPISVDDLKKIPDIIENYDFMILRDEKEHKEQGIFYVKKTEDGRYYFLEVIGTKKKALMAKTLWKASSHRVDAAAPKSGPPTVNAQDAMRVKPSTSESIITQSEEKVNSSKEHSDAGGYADVEPEYTGQKEQTTKDADVHSLAIEMPELLDLVRQINEGKLPLLKEKLGNALGKFSFRGEKGDIKLRRDIFIGERLGELTINPRKNYKSQVDAFKQGIFDQFGQEDIVFKRDGNKMIAYHRNPNLSIKVMAHEIGHLIDWLDEKTMSRGNLLGHLAALKNYMNHILPERPGAPGELTEADRRRLRAEAAKLATKEKQAEAEPQEPGMPTAEDIKGIWNDVAAKEKYPALYEYIAHLDGGQKAQVLKEAMKGMVNLPGFDPSKRINFKDWTAREKELYKKLIREELEKRRLFDLETITDELKKLTQIWKPFDDRRDLKYTRYRYSPEELYADAFSVLVNNPSLLKKTAPTFHRAFFNYLEARPNVKAVWDEIQRRIGDKRQTLDKRLDDVYIGFTEGDIEQKEANKRGKKELEPVKDTTAKGFIDKDHAILKYIRMYERKGGEMGEAATRLRNQIDEAAYISSKVYYYYHELADRVFKPLEKSGVTIKDLGAYMFFKRVINERSELANPWGFGEKTSTDTLERLKERLGAEKFAAVEKAAQEFRKVREEVIIPHVQHSRMFGQETIDMMKNRKHYARFKVIHYLRKTFGPGTTARIFQQVGTFNKIQNPVVATVLNDFTLMRAAKINETKTAAVSFLQLLKNTVPDKQNIITPADTRFDKNVSKMVAVEPQDPELALFDVMVDGTVHSFYIPKEIADTFAYQPVKANAITRTIGLMVNPVKKLFVSYNPAWMTRNMFFRDPAATVKNNQEIRNVKTFIQWARRSMQAMPEAARAIFRDELSPDLKEMYKNYMLNVNRIYDPEGKNSDDEIERIANEFQIEITDGKKVRNAWERVLRFFEMLDKAGQYSELTPKLGGFKFLKNETPLETAQIGRRVRNRIGTPNSRRRGTQTWWSDKLFFFANINKEGVRSGAEAFEDNPAVYTWKTALINVLPKLAILGLACGAMRRPGDDDDKWKKWANAIPDYHKRNYLIIPWLFQPWMTKDGKAMYLTVPTDYEGQFFGSLAHTLFKGKIFGKGGAVSVVTEQAPWDIMNPNPYLSVAADWAQYSLLGQNPVDEYRGQNIIPDKIFTAGGSESTLKMAQYTLNSLGLNTIYSLGSDKSENAYQKATRFFGLNAIGAFLKVSDRGVDEEYYEQSDKERQKKARKSLDIEKGIKKDVKALRRTPTVYDSKNLYWKLIESGIIAEDETFNEFHKQRYLGYAGKVIDDSRLSLILRARSKADRARALFQAKKNLSPAQYEKLKEKLANLEIEIEEE